MKVRNIKRIIITFFLTIMLVLSTVSNKAFASGNTESKFTRIYGQDRYETAISISRTGWPNGSDYVIIANGEEYYDSFCAVPLAKVYNAPIILTEKNNIDFKVLDELKRLKVKKIYIIGDERIISKNVEDQLKTNVDGKIERLYGKDIYDNSVKIAEKVGVSNKIILVSDKGYADALSAAPVAAIEGIPILVTDTDILSKSVSDYIKSHNIKKTYIIGGTGVISDHIASLVPGYERIDGKDRYETNINVLTHFFKDFNFKNLYTVSNIDNAEDGFADSLSGSILATKTSSPIVLIGKKVESCTENFIKSNIIPDTKIIALAGENSIPDSVLESFNVSSKSLNSSNTVCNDNIDSNLEIIGDNITFSGNVTGNMYVCGKDTMINNAVVSGTIFIDPGIDENVNLNNVKAKKIVILSGSKDGIHLKNIKADVLVIRSENNLKIIAEDGTKIDSTVLSSQAVIENRLGNFGDIAVTEIPIDKPVEFSGGFGNAISIEGSAMIKTSEHTIIPDLYINPTGAAKRVILDGEFKNIQVKGEADIVLDANVKVMNSIKVSSSAKVIGSGNRTISRIDIEPLNGDIINFSGDFGTTPIVVNSNANINIKIGSFIRQIRVEKKAALVNINVDKGANLYEVVGDAVVTGDGSDNTVIKSLNN